MTGGQIGDDRTRFADTRSLKAYADSAPVTRASGRSLSITHRRVKNDRLAAAGFVWAFVAAAHSPGASALYSRRREHGDRHAAPGATCSTGSSAASTTACKPVRHTKQPRRSQHRPQRPNPVDRGSAGAEVRHGRAEVSSQGGVRPGITPPLCLFGSVHPGDDHSHICAAHYRDDLSHRTGDQ
jgi:hypothetical protein